MSNSGDGDSAITTSGGGGGKSNSRFRKLFGKVADSVKPDEHGRFPIHIKAMEGDVQGVIDLIKLGANPNVTDKDGSTALLLAVKQDRCDVVRAMLSHCRVISACSNEYERRVISLMYGVSVEWVRNNVNKAQFVAVPPVEQDEYSFAVNPYSMDVEPTGKRKKKETVPPMLSVDQPDAEGMNALLMAVMMKSSTIAKMLVVAGADVDVKTASGVGIIQLCAGDMDIFEVGIALLEAGAAVEGVTMSQEPGTPSLVDIQSTLVTATLSGIIANDSSHTFMSNLLALVRFARNSEVHAMIVDKIGDIVNVLNTNKRLSAVLASQYLLATLVNSPSGLKRLSNSPEVLAAMYPLLKSNIPLVVEMAMVYVVRIGSHPKVLTTISKDVDINVIIDLISNTNVEYSGPDGYTATTNSSVSMMAAQLVAQQTTVLKRAYKLASIKVVSSLLSVISVAFANSRLSQSTYYAVRSLTNMCMHSETHFVMQQMGLKSVLQRVLKMAVGVESSRGPKASVLECSIKWDCLRGLVVLGDDKLEGYYLFDEPDSESNISLTEPDPDSSSNKGESLVRGASVVKLVECATSERSLEPDYLLAFLFTFRTFISPISLLRLLIHRYNVPSSPSPSPDTTQYVASVQLRVMNLLCLWIQLHHYDFHESNILLDMAMEFADVCCTAGYVAASNKIKKLLTSHSKQDRFDALGERSASMVSPKAILPKKIIEKEKEERKEKERKEKEERDKIRQKAREERRGRKSFTVSLSASDVFADNSPMAQTNAQTNAPYDGDDDVSSKRKTIAVSSIDLPERTRSDESRHSEYDRSEQLNSERNEQMNNDKTEQPNSEKSEEQSSEPRTGRALSGDGDDLPRPMPHMISHSDTNGSTNELDSYPSPSPIPSPIPGVVIIRGDDGDTADVPADLGVGPSELQTAPAPRTLSVPTGVDLFLDDIDPLELCRQMTLVEHDLFRKIRGVECIAFDDPNAPWNTKKQVESESNAVPEQSGLRVMIANFNRISQWMTIEVLFRVDIRDRANALKKFIQLAIAMYECHNYNGLMEVVAALHSAPVYRLQKTWNLVPKKLVAQYHDVVTVVEARGAFKNYREAIRQASPPVVPYLGVYMTDLTFIEDGNADTLQGGMVNFDKRRRAYRVIREIIQYQTDVYNYEVVPTIRDWLMGQRGAIDKEPLSSFQKRMHNRSLALEPR